MKITIFYNLLIIISLALAGTLDKCAKSDPQIIEQYRINNTLLTVSTDSVKQYVLSKGLLYPSASYKILSRQGNHLILKNFSIDLNQWKHVISYSSE